MYSRKKYKLPKEVYMQTLWAIRDYPRLKEEYDSLFGRAPIMDGQPKGTTPGDPTGSIAIKSAELSSKIAAVEKALNRIPEEYREGVMNSIVYRADYPDYAHDNTWKTWRQRFVFYVARNKNLY